MRYLALLVALGLTPNATAQLQFASTPGDYVRVLNGQVFIGSKQVSTSLGLATQPTPHSQLTVSPSTVSLTSSGNDVPLDAKLDPNGNIWIAGNTDSDDFPLLNPIFATKPPYATAGFVIELDPTAAHLLFATYVAGQQAQLSTHATALQIDHAGNVYVGGDTDQPDFPTTAGTILTPRKPGIGIAATYFYSYLMKISPAGKLIYSTLLNTGTATCTGGSACIGHDSTFARISSISVDTTGAAIVAGPEGGALRGDGRVSRVAADASIIIWSGTVGDNYGSVDQLLMTQDAAGNLIFLGRYAPLAVTPGLPAQSGSPPGLFAAKLSPDASQQIYSIDLGQSLDSAAIGIALDATGEPCLAGISSSAKLPTLAGVPNLGANFVLVLDAAGAAAQKLFRFPTGVVVAPPTFDTVGNLLLLGAEGALLTLPPTYDFKRPMIVGFANSASYVMNTGLYPGALVSFFGYGLPSNAQVVMNGNAQVLYSGPTQINVQVAPSAGPYAGTVYVILSSQTLSFNPPAIQSLGIFTTDGTHAAALNQDGSPNSASDPAPLNSVVSFFGTGASGPAVSGYGAAAYIDTAPQDVLYFGPAPGLIGVFQANILVTAAGAITLQTPGFFPGELISNSVSIYTK